MRTLCVLESVSRADGGIFEAERALQCALVREAGVEVSVVGLRDEYTEQDLARWGALAPRVAEVRGPAGLGWAPGLAALMREDVDLGYCAALWKYPAWAFLDWQKRTGKPVVVAPHGSLDAWALRNSRWKKRLAGWFFKDEQLRRASCFRALCLAEADAIRACGLRQRIEVVPNGVVVPAELAGDRRSKIGARAGRRRLLFLGRIHPKKGLLGLVRAWANLKREMGNAKWGEWELVIAGWDQGGHEAELKALCGELGLRIGEGADGDVYFHGPAFGEAKEALLRSAEAFVLPSFSEGLPMSVLEAWSYGLPVVMTPECNLPEGFAGQAALEIRNGEMGNAKWDGLRELLDMSEANRREMGMRGRRLVEERFTWPTVAARMREVFESLV
jgi:poly(glycerol-phosphate) alpha-glucosyltransferase